MAQTTSRKCLRNVVGTGQPATGLAGAGSVCRNSAVVTCGDPNSKNKPALFQLRHTECACYTAGRRPSESPKRSMPLTPMCWSISMYMFDMGIESTS